ncbi:hypothetical protein A2U01_0058591, partial [Trifolium medium]|nr:hypothetical protein [Trifolium medium]
TDYVLRTPSPEADNSIPVISEVENSPEAIEIPSEKPTSEQVSLKLSSELQPPSGPTPSDHPTTSE